MTDSNRLKTSIVFPLGIDVDPTYVGTADYFDALEDYRFEAAMKKISTAVVYLGATGKLPPEDWQ